MQASDVGDFTPDRPLETPDTAGRCPGSARGGQDREAHDVPFMVEHRQPVCKLTFERMLEEPTHLYGKGIGSSYQQQTETLGRHFRLPDRAAMSARASRPRSGHRAPGRDQLDLLHPDA